MFEYVPVAAAGLLLAGYVQVPRNAIRLSELEIEPRADADVDLDYLCPEGHFRVLQASDHIPVVPDLGND